MQEASSLILKAIHSNTMSIPSRVNMSDTVVRDGMGITVFVV